MIPMAYTTINKASVLFLLLLASTLWSPDVNASPADDAAALLAFKQASIETDPSKSLQSWITIASIPPSPCSWAGVFCSSGGYIAGLNLNNFGLKGRLEIDKLMGITTLKYINFQGNSFYGNLSHTTPLPSCNLETVDLSRNNFTENIVGSFLAGCSHLWMLNLSVNAITGGVYPFGPSLLQLDLSGNKISDNDLLGYSLSNCQSLNYLNLSSNQLTSGIAGASACASLAVLDLSSNPFSSEFPEILLAKLPASLKQLVLSHCNFSGDFSKANFGVCGNLTIVDLSSNLLVGNGLPLSLASCQFLEQLDLSDNQISGSLPSFWPSLKKLKRLFISNNKFSGSIPVELGQICPTLTDLDLSSNSLTGGLPSSFISCSALEGLNLGNNQFSDDFVSTVISTMPSLRLLSLPFNGISGVVPLLPLKNCTKLEEIDISSNLFSGDIPIGFCPSLPSLRKLILPNNYISGKLPPELAKCTGLTSIDLSFNMLTGPIPPEIFTLLDLKELALWANNITGELPDNICSKSASLQILILNHNHIGGRIPDSLTKCRNLIWVSLAHNNFTGPIPSNIGNLQSLALFQAGDNSLTGEIPPSLGNCPRLTWLELNNNELSGPIPYLLASQAGLVVPTTSLSTKHFAFLKNEGGSCPGAGVIFEFDGIRSERLLSSPLVHACPETRVYIGSMAYPFASNGSIVYLDISHNLLSGPIPDNFGNLSYAQVLNLGHNQLTGPIPVTFAGLKMVSILDLSHNNLSGPIPGGLVLLSLLNSLDISNNNLSGPIPTSGQFSTFPASVFENNPGLCGPPLRVCVAPMVQSSNPNFGERKRLLGVSVAIGISISAVIILVLVFLLFRVKSKQNTDEVRVGYIESLPKSGTGTWKISGELEPLSINVAAFEKPLKKLTFAHLLEATNGFSNETLIGCGGFGEVYKARLKDSSTVAIKKLAHVTGQGDREFTAEMETIGKIKHRNLVPLLGYCKVGDERLLVYEYMEHGSLDNVLVERKDKGAVNLDWAMRKRIAIGSARGLAFLHHSCIPHIIHRDMKSSNVLLDENLEARVSDFGMARLVNAIDTHLSVSTLAGTPGYVPPEYYQSFRCTTKGDVYSYGVVLLELLSGKKPIDTAEFGDNNLVGWAKQLAKENRGIEVIDSELVDNMSDQTELLRYLKIAFECLEDRPLRRPTMIQVMTMFKELEGDSDSDVFDGLSFGDMSLDESREKVP